MTIVVIGEMRFPPERLNAVRPHLRRLVEATRALDGCIAYDAAEDLFDPGLVRLSEIWPDRAALARHLQAPHIVPWRAVAAENSVTGRRFLSWAASDPLTV